MPETLRPPGSGRFSYHRDPPAVRRAVLRLLLDADRPLKRRPMGAAIFGTDKLGGTAIAAALGTLRADGLVVEVRRDTWAPTELAAEALEVADLYVAARPDVRRGALVRLEGAASPVLRLVVA